MKHISKKDIEEIVNSNNLMTEVVLDTLKELLDEAWELYHLTKDSLTKTEQTKREIQLYQLLILWHLLYDIELR